MDPLPISSLAGREGENAAACHLIMLPSWRDPTAVFDSCSDPCVRYVQDRPEAHRSLFKKIHDQSVLEGHTTLLLQKKNHEILEGYRPNYLIFR